MQIPKEIPWLPMGKMLAFMTVCFITKLAGCRNEHLFSWNFPAQSAHASHSPNAIRISFHVRDTGDPGFLRIDLTSRNPATIDR